MIVGSFVRGKKWYSHYCCCICISSSSRRFSSSGSISSTAHETRAGSMSCKCDSSINLLAAVALLPTGAASIWHYCSVHTAASFGQAVASLKKRHEADEPLMIPPVPFEVSCHSGVRRAYDSLLQSGQTKVRLETDGGVNDATIYRRHAPMLKIQGYAR